MDLFGEKKYEELDYLTKMIEPVTWKALDVAAQLPDQVEIPHDTLIEQLAKHHQLDFNLLFDTYVLGNLKFDHYRDLQFFRKRYSLQIEPGTIVNFENNTISGSIHIVKTEEMPDEKELEEVIKRTSDDLDRYAFGSDDEAKIDRAKEILDLFGTEVAQRGIKKRTMGAIAGSLGLAFKDVMRNNRWNIRSVDLARKLSTWIYAYIHTGNGAAMRNFCLLKAATHRGYPLYEIEEEEL